LGNTSIAFNYSKQYRRDGELINESGLAIMNPDGTNVQDIISSEPFYEPDWSPDGKRILCSGWRDGKSEIYLIDINSKNITKIV